MSTRTLVVLLTAAAVLPPVSLPAFKVPRVFHVPGAYQFTRTRGVPSPGCAPDNHVIQGTLTIVRFKSGYILRVISTNREMCHPKNICRMTGSCQGKNCVFTSVAWAGTMKKNSEWKMHFTYDQARGLSRTVVTRGSGSCTWTSYLFLKKKY